MSSPGKKAAKTTFQTSQEEMKLRAAWLYFVEGQTQEQVAKHLGINRIKASRLLSAAREDGSVHISINAQAEPLVRLQRSLERHFGLYEVIVVPSMNGSDASVSTVIGHATGRYISGRVENGLIVGVGWGDTLHSCMRALSWREAKDMTTVSLIGGLTHATLQNPSAVAWRFAEFFETALYQITAPAFVADEALAAALWEQKDLKKLYEKARDVDIALIGVSDIGKQAPVFRHELLSQEDGAGLRAAGAVGDVLFHFIDAQGNVVDHPANRRAMAINPHHLRKVPKVVIAAGGARKAQAIRAAIIATGAKVLITDETAARALLEMDAL